MTETTKPATRSPEDKQFAEELVERARDEGVGLVGPDGLLAGLTKDVLEAGREAEMSEHLGYDKHDPGGHNSGNSRNGTRPKKVLTDVGPVAIEVPRDREGSFEPQLVNKHQRRLTGVDEMVISLAAKGPTIGEVAAHMSEDLRRRRIQGHDQSDHRSYPRRDDGLAEPSSGPGLPGRVHRRHGRQDPYVGQVTNRPVYAAIGVTVDGERDILGLWAGSGGEGAKSWLQVLTETREPWHRRRLHRRVRRPERSPRSDRQHVAAGDRPDLCAAPESATRFWFASKADWDKMARDLRPVYTAISEHDAKERFAEFAEVWGDKYPAIIRLWENSWVEFAPFLDYPAEIRKVIYSTNAVESLHARMRRATRARGHFPTEQAALKCLYLVEPWSDPTGRGPKRWMNRPKAALNAFAITFDRRILPTDR